MHTILCIDCATPVAVIGLVQDGEVRAERLLTERRAHAERMYGAIDEVLGEARVELPDLSAVAVGLGPGSFIGVRVALATAKGLALGAELPVVGVSTLAALGLASGRSGNVAVGLDAKKGQLYAAVYRIQTGDQVPEELMEPSALDPAPCAARFIELAPLSAMVGDGVTRYAEAFDELPKVERLEARPAAHALYTLACERVAARQWDDVDTLVPGYVRRSEAEEKRAAAERRKATDNTST